MGKVAAGCVAVGLASVASVYAFVPGFRDGVNCSAEVVTGNNTAGSISKCFGWDTGHTEVTATVQAPVKEREFPVNTIQKHVLGEVAMTLKGEANVRIDNEKWKGFWEGPGSNITWNKNNEKVVTARYQVCFGTDLADKGGINGIPPKSTLQTSIVADGLDRVKVKVFTEPIEVCSTRVAAGEEAGGLANEQLWKNDDGGFFKTNMDTEGKDEIEAVLRTALAALIVDSVNAQACPLEALQNGGMSLQAVEREIAKVALGGLLEIYGSDKVVRDRITQAFADQYPEPKQPGQISEEKPIRDSFRVHITSDAKRVEKYQAILNARIASMTGTTTKIEGLEDTTIRWSVVANPTKVSCGTGKLMAAG
ncbi:hypothetical protein IPL85_00570 [Candidatus Saccharibacteria bacterium]|nr:MAG: hypothetical protein IPL85_00570 [Candidatus Saccharibacteria bacterium]